MSASLRPRMTLDDFLAWEVRQELRYEFDGIGPVVRPDETVGHVQIQMNLYGQLHQALRGSRCRMFSSSMKIQVAGRIRYPDAFVACSTYPRDASVIDDPIVVFEVLSPSTARIDRIVKLGEYRDTPSIQRYVMLEQDFQAAIVLTRNGNDWVTTAVDADGTLSLPEIEVELPLADLYEGIEMPDDSVG